MLRGWISANVLSRGINVGSKQDLDDLCDALSAVQMRLDDIIDSTFAFEKADEAIEHVWQAKQVGKVIVEL
jgi:NADPH:quinone reductase-like Zn-dependent oxidoreductase